MTWYQRGVIRQQWPLLALIGSMVVIYIWQEVAGRAAYSELMVRPALITESWADLRAGGADGSDWGTFGTLFTYALLHGSGEHILFNLVILWMFAALTAELLGSWWMLGIFVFTAITGGLCHVIFNAHEYRPMLGASGAVMGFEGAYLGMAVRWALPDPHVWPIARPIPPAHLAILAVLAAFLDWYAIMEPSGSNVAFGAHLGGFIGGLFLTSFIARKPKLARPR